MRKQISLKTAFAFLIIFLLLPCAVHSKTAVEKKTKKDVAAPIVPVGMKLVWADEFDGPGINLSNWTYETRATGWSPTWNNEYQSYTDNGTNGPNAFISNGCLVIMATKANNANDFNSYRSARMTTLKLQSWKYGIIAARIKMPFGNGIWPAFWMMGTNSQSTSWPNCGEIDIVEMVGGTEGQKKGGGDNVLSGALHGPNYSGDLGKQAYLTVTNTRLGDDFHVYWISWSKTNITWYYDNAPFLKVSSSDVANWVFDKYFYILLNLAVGGNWPGYPDRTTVFPQTMIVDWIRVYQ